MGDDSLGDRFGGFAWWKVTDTIQHDSPIAVSSRSQHAGRAIVEHGLSGTRLVGLGGLTSDTTLSQLADFATI
jgi:hypothetical protein